MSTSPALASEWLEAVTLGETGAPRNCPITSPKRCSDGNEEQHNGNAKEGQGRAGANSIARMPGKELPHAGLYCTVSLRPEANLECDSSCIPLVSLSFARPTISAGRFTSLFHLVEGLQESPLV